MCLCVQISNLGTAPHQFSIKTELENMEHGITLFYSLMKYYMMHGKSCASHKTVSLERIWGNWRTVMHENTFNKSDPIPLLQVPSSVSHKGWLFLRRSRKLQNFLKSKSRESDRLLIMQLLKQQQNPHKQCSCTLGRTEGGLWRLWEIGSEKSTTHYLGTMILGHFR